MIKSMQRMWAPSIGTLCALVSTVAQADLLIEVGDHVIDANASEQTISLQISGGDLITVYDIVTRIGPLDGPAPLLTGLDTTTGTIFLNQDSGSPADLNKDGVLDPDRIGGQFGLVTTPVSGNGLIATITFDTTGIADGTYPLMLGEVVISNEDTRDTFFTDLLGPLPISIVNGSITLSTASLTPGDADLDGDVDTDDLGILATNFDQNGRWADGDFNADGAVDLDDLTIMGTFFGTGVSANALNFSEALALVSFASPVPEPGTVVLILLSGGVAFIRHGRG